MTSCNTRELGARFFVSAGMSCIRVSWLPFPRFFIAHGRGLLSCRALDNIERLIPFLRQQSNAAWLQMAKHSERLPSDGPTLTKPFQMDGLKQLLQSALDRV